MSWIDNWRDGMSLAEIAKWEEKAVEETERLIQLAQCRWEDSCLQHLRKTGQFLSYEILAEQLCALFKNPPRYFGTMELLGKILRGNIDIEKIEKTEKEERKAER